MQHRSGDEGMGGMTMSRTVRLAGLLAVLTCAGCVERKFIVESNVPNAQVYIDNKSIGAAPAYSSFEYYGNYKIMVVHPGYETVTQLRPIHAPWYGYPPFDFITEALWPFHIHDTRRIYIELHEATQTRSDDILNAADALRQRGALLPPPERPAQPRTPPQPAVPTGPTIGPPVAPSVGPGSGVVPPAPAPIPTPTPGPPPGVIPSVQPGYTPAPGSTYLK
jgi:hypothetical protein